MGSLFDQIDKEDTNVRYQDWRPSEPPCLDGIDELYMDFETNGLKWFDGHEIIGIGYQLPDGKSGYMPMRHKVGPNLDPAVVKRWMQEQLKHKRITNHTIKTEVHFSRKEGVDLEAQGCTVSDVSHYAALLDDSRKKFSQEILCKDYLDDEEKVKVIDGITIDPTRMADYHSGMIAQRAIGDVRQVAKLKEKMWPLMDKEDLQRVRQLEDDVIFPVCEMEWNGALIDTELLNELVTKAKTELEDCLYAIYKETGIRFNPDSSDDWTRLFNHLRIPITQFTSGGKSGKVKGSFTGVVLKNIDHPMVQRGLRAGKLADLLSKYLVKYQKTVDHNGILRFALHQVRWSQDDERSADEAGTGSGRFSSSAIKINNESIGANIQQVLAVEKNIESYGDDYIIRELFIALTGRVTAADAQQIEYRIFADYAKNKRVLAAYKENPRLKFHHLIWEMIKPFKPDLLYKPVKNLNFAKIYGAGLAKLALMLEFITPEEFKWLNRTYSQDWKGMRADPLLAETLKIDQIYRRELPEVAPLLERASRLAMERGYVKTILGRRIRFPDKQRPHKALNGVIQGSAADIFKRKTVDVHRERKRIGFLPRLPVHDELVGDSASEETPIMLGEILDRQAFPHMEVPILWDVKSGANWGECK